MAIRLKEIRLLSLFFLWSIGYSAFCQYDGKVGINLGNVQADFFVDMVKSAGPWRHGNSALAPDQIDKNGWPRVDFSFVLMDPRPVAEWSSQIDDPESYRIDRSGTYKSRFSGQAQIQNIGGNWTLANQEYDPVSNTTSFDLEIGPLGPDHGLVIMNFTDTRRSDSSQIGSGITDFEILKPGFEIGNGQLYTDYFFQTLSSANFAAIRSQNFTGTTGWDILYPQEYQWNDRKPENYSNQSRSLGTYREKAAWEHYINMCNRAQMDIWINVPISASDDYVTSLASLLLDQLDENLNIYVENDNEVWNSAEAFVGTWNYNQAEAEALGLTFEENIAQRAVELSQLFASVFGDEAINDRFRVILASHSPMLKWWVQPMLVYIKDTFGDPNKFIYGLSRQLYFRSDGAAPNASVGDLLAQFFDNIDFQLEDQEVNEAGRLDWVRVAQEWQLPGGVTSYEGGPHTPCCGNLDNFDNEIGAHRHPNMKKVLQYNLANNWFDIGGGLAMHFTLYSGYNRYGAWGLTDDMKNPDRNYKFEALRNLQPIVSGIDQTYDRKWTVWPNPVSNVLKIRSDFPSEVHLRLVDLLGRSLLQQESMTSEHNLHLTGIKDGLYYLLISDGKNSEAHKIVIQAK